MCQILLRHRRFNTHNSLLFLVFIVSSSSVMFLGHVEPFQPWTSAITHQITRNSKHKVQTIIRPSNPSFSGFHINCSCTNDKVLLTLSVSQTVKLAMLQPSLRRSLLKARWPTKRPVSKLWQNIRLIPAKIVLLSCLVNKARSTASSLGHPSQGGCFSRMLGILLFNAFSPGSSFGLWPIRNACYLGLEVLLGHKEWSMNTNNQSMGLRMNVPSQIWFNSPRNITLFREHTAQFGSLEWLSTWQES